MKASRHRVTVLHVAWTTIAVVSAIGCGGTSPAPRRVAATPIARGELHDTAPPNAEAAPSISLREARSLFWLTRRGEGRHCAEWHRERDRLWSRFEERGETFGYRIEWDAGSEGFTMTGAFVGERVLECRHQVRVVDAGAAAVRTNAGDLYRSLGDCVGALSAEPALEDALSETAEPVMDLGGCAGAIELLHEVRPAPSVDPVAALVAGDVTVHVLRPLDGALRCQAWRSVRRGDHVDLVHRAERGTATRGRLQYRSDEHGPRLGFTADAWQGDDGSMMALGSYDVHVVRFVDERVFLVGGSAWFVRAEDCEAAREAEGVAAWLRSR